MDSQGAASAMAASSALNTATSAAKKGLGMVYSASKVAAAAIQTGVQKARKGYANKHEQDVLNELKSKNLPTVEHLVAVLKRFYYLRLAGYNHELQAAAMISAKRLIDPEKSTVPIDVVVLLGDVLTEETLKYGEFQKSGIVQGMQDLMNKSRMGKDHFDRDSIAHDVYYIALILSEEFDTEWEKMQACIRDAVTRLVEWAVVTEQTPDAREKAAKSVYRLAQAIKEAGVAAEERRQKTIREAENTLRKEQERRKTSPPLALSSTGSSTPSGATIPTASTTQTTPAYPVSQNPYAVPPSIPGPSAPPY